MEYLITEFVTLKASCRYPDLGLIVINADLAIERIHSHDQQPYWFTEAKDNF